MAPATKPLSRDEERQLAALQERREAAQAALDDTRGERQKKVRTLDDLIDHVAAEVRTRVAPPAPAAEATPEEGPDIRKEIANLCERVDSLVDDINALGKKETDLAGGGIGYDHQDAISRHEKDDRGAPRFNVARAIYGHLAGWGGETRNWIERELIEEYHKTLQVGVSSAGGFMVAPQWMAEMIELLRPNLVIAALGANFRPLDGPTSFRKMDGGASSFWVAEGKKATKSEPSVGRINLAPKPLVTMVPISDDLLQMGPAGFESEIENDMSRSQAETLDLAAMKGQGGEGEPIGMVNVAGGTSDWAAIDGGQDYGTTLQNITIILDDMVYQILARNVSGPIGFAMSPLMLQKIRTTRDTTGGLIFSDSQTNRGGDDVGNAAVETGILHGRRYATTSQLAAGADADIIAAAWRNLMVANFGPAEVFPSRHASDPSDNSSAYMFRETWVRYTQKWDVGFRHTEAIQVASNADAT